jgi:hypothetical protein
MEMMFGGRYVIYTGLIYNEFFSVPFELFGKSAYACLDPSCRYACIFCATQECMLLKSLFINGAISCLLLKNAEQPETSCLPPFKWEY